jgi:hypothetical protein
MFAGMVGLALTGVLILGAPVAALIGRRAFRLSSGSRSGLPRRSSKAASWSSSLGRAALGWCQPASIKGGRETLHTI